MVNTSSLSRFSARSLVLYKIPIRSMTVGIEFVPTSLRISSISSNVEGQGKVYASSFVVKEGSVIRNLLVVDVIVLFFWFILVTSSIHFFIRKILRQIKNIILTPVFIFVFVFIFILPSFSPSSSSSSLSSSDVSSSLSFDKAPLPSP